MIHRHDFSFGASTPKRLHQATGGAGNAVFQFCILVALLTTKCAVHAQQIQARLAPGYNGLSFNQPGFPIVSGNQQAYQIPLYDSRTQVVEIVAPSRTPLLIQINSPQELWNLQVYPAESLPFAVEAAFSNEGLNDERSARRQAVPLPHNQLQYQFEMADYQPIPGNPDLGEDLVKAFLYLYGRMGPVGRVAPGLYQGQIQVEVWY